MNIAVNQLGFLPGAQKEVTFYEDLQAESFDIIDAADRSVKASFPMTEKRFNPNTGNDCRMGDFSAFCETGTYRIKAGDQVSEPFEIGDQVYDGILGESVYMLHLQRCGCALSKEEAGDFAHASCHDTPARIYGTQETIDVTGGWHDAGDYGRYIVPAAKTIVDVLLAYDRYPKVLDGTNLKIAPSILDEVRWEIDWMLKMQREDGGVYHKVTCATFPEMDVMPEFEREELIVCPVSNASASCFAASLALASCVYEETDPAYANRLLEAAEKAFAYVKAHMDEPGFTNPDDIRTGEYGDANWIDEYYWAAAQLYRVTAKEEYHDAVKEILKDERALTWGLGWEKSGSYGSLAYIGAMDCGKRRQNGNPSVKTDPSVLQTVLDALLTEADAYTKAAEEEAFGCSVLDGSFHWGSNMEVANQGMTCGLLLGSNLVDEQRKIAYAKTFERQIAYLLGRNGTGYCYVTGFGWRPVKNPHHRPSVAMKKAMRGMLVGGPDNGLHDPFAEKDLAGKAPELCFLDDSRSYSTNEITIYWNSPLIYLLAQLIGGQA